MKHLTITLSTAIILVTAILSCGESITEPNYPSGRRDYVWTVDTLNMPMNNFYSIWGSSPTDIWTVGAGGDSDDRLLHYDGVKWQTYNKEPIRCTGQTLFGFSSSIIWMGGGDGALWYYNGSSWNAFFSYLVEGTPYVQIKDIWGRAWNDVYACGTINFPSNGVSNFRGFVLHFDGKTWKELVKVNLNSQFLRIRTDKKSVYVISYSPYKGNSYNDTLTFYELKENTLRKIYANSTANVEWASLITIGEHVHFLIGKDVYKVTEGNMKKVLTIDHTNFGYQIYGRSINDLFLRMKDGIAHYNGSDISYLHTFPIYSQSITNIPAIFDTEILFGTWELSTRNNLILHGKLKK